MNQLETNRFSVNIYDVFANFLPGFILIGGIVLPFLGSEKLAGFGALEATMATFSAFAIGGGTQAIGSYLKRYKFRLPFANFPSESGSPSSGKLISKRTMPFDDRMEEISEDDDGSELPLAEGQFFEVCAEVFDLDDGEEISDWKYLFKLCIAYLEASPYNRTLRIQAQHLAARGIYVALIILSVYYISISMISYRIQEISPVWVQGDIISEPVLILLATFCFGLSYIFYIRAVHFEEDVVKYMISEFLVSNAIKETEP